MIVKNKKIFDPKLHLDVFAEIIKYAEKKHKLNDFLVEINSVSGEIVFSKGRLDIYATPFMDGDRITFHIMNDYYIEKESVSIRVEAEKLRKNDMTILEFVHIFFSIVRRKIVEWKL